MESPLTIFINKIFSITDKTEYVKTYFKIFSSPSKRIISFFSEKDIHFSMDFLVKSLGFYAIVVMAKMWRFEGDSIVSDIVLSLYFIVIICLNGYLCYVFLRRKAKIQRTFQEYFSISSLFYGFSIPLAGIATLLLLYSIPKGLQCMGLMSLLLIIMCVYLFIHMMKIFKYFWGHSTRRILFYVIVASWISGILSFGFLYIVHNAFGLNMTVDKNIFNPNFISKSSDVHWERTYYSILSLELPNKPIDLTNVKYPEDTRKIISDSKYVVSNLNFEMSIDVVYEKYNPEIGDSLDVDYVLRANITNIYSLYGVEVPELKINSIDLDNIPGKRVIGKINKNDATWEYSISVFNKGLELWIICSRFPDTEMYRSIQLQFENSIQFGK